MFIDLNPLNHFLLVAGTISFGMSGAHEPSFFVVSPASLSNYATQIFSLPCQVASSSTEWVSDCFRYHCLIILALVFPLNTTAWKWFLVIILLTKKRNWIFVKAFCHVLQLQWGSKKSYHFHLHIEGHDCVTLTPPPMIPVVEILFFLHPFVRCLLARTVLFYAQEIYLLIKMFFYPILLLMAQVPLLNILIRPLC